jgi:hypothetical protein
MPAYYIYSVNLLSYGDASRPKFDPIIELLPGGFGIGKVEWVFRWVGVLLLDSPCQASSKSCSGEESHTELQTDSGGEREDIQQVISTAIFVQSPSSSLNFVFSSVESTANVAR